MASDESNANATPSAGRRTAAVFGNPMPQAVIRKAQAQKAGFMKRFGEIGRASCRERV